MAFLFFLCSFRIQKVHFRGSCLSVCSYQAVLYKVMWFIAFCLTGWNNIWGEEIDIELTNRRADHVQIQMDHFRSNPYITLAKKDKPNFSMEKDWLGYADVVDSTVLKVEFLLKSDWVFFLSPKPYKWFFFTKIVLKNFFHQTINSIFFFFTKLQSKIFGQNHKILFSQENRKTNFLKNEFSQQNRKNEFLQIVKKKRFFPQKP